MRSPVLRTCTALVMIALGSSCGGGSESPPVTTTPLVPATPVLTTLTVTLSASSLAPGGTAVASATGADQTGKAFALTSITWTSTNTAVATINASGIITAVGVGQTAIIGASGTVSALQNIVVASNLPVATVALTPSTTQVLVGGTQTLTAALKDTPGNVLGGRAITWTSSASNIASVSATGVVTGVAVGTATISATSEGQTGVATITVSAAIASVSLAAAGQSATFLTSPNFSETLRMQAGAQYLVAVVNTSSSYVNRADFSLTGSFAAGTVAEAAPAAVRASSVTGPVFDMSTAMRDKLANRRRLQKNHLAILEENRQIVRSFGQPGAAWAKARAQSGRAEHVSAAVIQQTIGAVNKVWIRNTSTGGSCTARDSIGARTVAVGQHVIVLADTNTTTWKAAFRPDSAFYTSFAAQFDQVTWPHLLANIGDPLRMDASLSRVGKVTVTFTPVLNNYSATAGGGSIVAFVSSCDFFPFARTGVNADLSNETEMFYSWVPATNGSSVSEWVQEVGATAAHELKHIVSFSNRFVNDSDDFEEIWLEEGLAQVSSEMWGRTYNQATWKGAANFLQTVACEIPLGVNAPCDINNDKPYNLMSSNLPYFFEYLQDMSDLNDEGLGLDVAADYGGGWVFSRWVIDQYAAGGTEGPFIKSLIDEPRLTGIANISAHTGQSAQTILTYWNLASAIFQVPAYTAADVRTTIPSFNFADIFNFGQTRLTCSGKPCGLFTSSGAPVFPIQPIQVASGTISQSVTGVRGTGAAYFLVTGSAAGIQSLRLLDRSGGALGAGSQFRVGILRVK
ncbi:MAG: Peptidase hyicolysin [Gemmatimonadetes bacterium]|nr:Peptidase hyicolysin [Gemmatimonadota bacterium]